MKYDFDKIIDRRNSNSYKWNVEKGELALWVADMDFETAPCVKNAIIKRAEHGVFGYSDIPDAWADAYIFWWQKRHNFQIKKEDLIFSTGVVPTISSCVRKLTSPAEKVLIQPPVYNIFYNSIINNGRFIVESPLDYDEKRAEYSINFTRLEKDLADPQVTLMILCNPHNPCGKIWQKEELQKIGELCKKYNVTLLSDEIHCDIVKPTKNYVPFASVSEICKDISVTCIAPSKCFNLAGLNSSAVVASNAFLRHKVWRALNTDEVAEPNAFAVDATIEAFLHGEDWLNELNAYLFENRKIAENFINKNMPAIKAIKADATYLLWLNVAGCKMSGDNFSKNLREKTGVFISGGSQYGKTAENFVRINLACPKATLLKALEKMKTFYDEIM